MKKAIKRKEVLLNGKISETGMWVNSGDKIQLIASPQSAHKVYEFDLKVLFEDEYLAVVYKPAGLLVSGNQFKTFKNALPHNLQNSTLPDALERPLPVHRLDLQTSGLLLVAKTAKANILLNQLFEERNIKKQYVAIVIGQMPNEGKIETLVNGKESLSLYKNRQTVPSLKNDYLSLVSLFPQTGRTHQLRIHLSELGFPILGDKLYGQINQVLKHKGLFLSAIELAFIHPISQEKLIISAPVPEKFEALLEREKRRWERYF